MFKEVNKKEYMAVVGKLIRNGKYHFANTHNQQGESYKFCCIDEKTNKTVAYREKIDEVFKNYIWIEDDNNEN